MKRYVVTLDEAERKDLTAITNKGSHRSQKVINALILLNCDEGQFNERQATGEAIADILRISMRKVDRAKKRFVEAGIEAALGGRQGRRPTYLRKADGEFEARPGGVELWRATGWPRAMVAAAAGGPRRGTRLHRQRVARDGAAGSKKNEIKPWASGRMGDPAATQRGLRGGHGAGPRRVPASVRQGLSRGLHGRDAAPVDPRDARAGPRRTGPASPPRLRVPALRNLQRIHGHGALGRQAHDPG